MIFHFKQLCHLYKINNQNIFDYNFNARISCMYTETLVSSYEWLYIVSVGAFLCCDNFFFFDSNQFLTNNHICVCVCCTAQIQHICKCARVRCTIAFHIDFSIVRCYNFIYLFIFIWLFVVFIVHFVLFTLCNVSPPQNRPTHSLAIFSNAYYCNHRCNRIDREAEILWIEKKNNRRQIQHQK